MRWGVEGEGAILAGESRDLDGRGLTGGERAYFNGLGDSITDIAGQGPGERALRSWRFPDSNVALVDQGSASAIRGIGHRIEDSGVHDKGRGQDGLWFDAAGIHGKKEHGESQEKIGKEPAAK